MPRLQSLRRALGVATLALALIGCRDDSAVRARAGHGSDVRASERATPGTDSTRRQPLRPDSATVRDSLAAHAKAPADPPCVASYLGLPCQ